MADAWWMKKGGAIESQKYVMAKKWQVSSWITFAENSLDSWIVITLDAILPTHIVCVQLTGRAEKMFPLEGESVIWASANKDE